MDSTGSRAGCSESRSAQRVRVVEAWREADGLNRGRVLDISADPIITVPAEQAWLGEVVRQVMPEAGDTYRHVERREDAAWIGNRLAEMLPLSLADKQMLLELTDPLERLSALSPPQPRPVVSGACAASRARGPARS